MRKIKKNTLVAALLATLIPGRQVANADQDSAIGVGDTEIRIGNIMPYTGPLAAFFARVPKLDCAAERRDQYVADRLRPDQADASCAIRRHCVAADR